MSEAAALTLDEVMDGLDFDIPAPRQGRPRKIDLALSRQLNERDRAASGSAGPVPRLLQIKNTHHSIARLLAEGKRSFEVSAITGFTPGYIASLQSDPAFKELLAYYGEQKEELWVDVQVRLRDLGVMGVEELTQRLAEEPGKFKPRELMELIALTMDRSGHGPTSKVAHLHGNFPEELLRTVKEEASRRSRGTVTTINAEALPADHRPALGEASGQASLPSPEAARSEGEGPDV